MVGSSYIIHIDCALHQIVQVTGTTVILVGRFQFKVAKCRLVTTLRDSDTRVGDAGVQTRIGRKWLALTAVDQAESMLEIRDIIGNTCTGKQGFGMIHFKQWAKATPTETCSVVKSESETRRWRQEKNESSEAREAVGLDAMITAIYHGGDVEERSFQESIRTEVCIWHASIRCIYLIMGISRGPKLQALWEESDDGSHTIRMPGSTDKGDVQKEARHGHTQTSWQNVETEGGTFDFFLWRLDVDDSQLSKFGSCFSAGEYVKKPRRRLQPDD